MMSRKQQAAQAAKPIKKETPKRRYPVGKEPLYDNAFMAWEGHDGGLHWASTIDQVENLLIQWRGERDGLIRAGNLYPMPSILLDGKNRLRAVRDEFKSLKQKAVNEGRVPPEEPPMDLHDRRLQAEAQTDAARANVRLLEGMLKSLSEEEDKKRAILPKGPTGAGKLQGGKLCIVDGQRVSPSPDGILFIDEPRSPYNGLLVPDYRVHIVKPWLRQKGEFRERMEKFDLAKRHADEIGAAFAGKQPQKPPWPPIPKGVKLLEIKK